CRDGKYSTVAIPSHSLRAKCARLSGTSRGSRLSEAEREVWPALPMSPATMDPVGQRIWLGCRLLAIRLEPGVDQRHGRVDDRVAQPHLGRNELHQLVGALDIGHAVVERARGR